MNDLPPHSYRLEARELGRGTETIENALAARARIRSRGGYPVLTLRHLSQLTGCSWKYLREVVSRQKAPYQAIERRKRNGRVRDISSPEPVLMDVQRWILSNILTATEVHPRSYAYQSGKSIVDCAQEHLGARWLLKLDIHDFFHAIKERRVFKVFRGLGYPSLLSFELARICTQAAPTGLRFWSPRFENLPYPPHPEGRLPQGAPTSGLLANAVTYTVDEKLEALARNYGLVYTRYSDDLTFSSAADFSRREAMSIVHNVAAVLENLHLSAHRAKTRIVPPGARHVVLGLLLTAEGVRLLPEFKRRIEVHIRGVDMFGVAEHADHRRFESVLSMINHVDGCIAFSASVEPAFAAAASSAWDHALRKRGFPVDT